MNRVVKSTRGAISIFVALMMTGILSLGTFVLEAARLQAARTQLGEAASSAASSMLSSYNLELKDRYGILAIDNDRADEAACMEYLKFNSDLATMAFGNNVTRLYKVDDVDMSGVYNLTYPHILKRQLLTVAKYNLPPERSEVNTYNINYILNDLQMRCQYVSNTMQEILNSAKGGTVSDVPAQRLSALKALDKTFGKAPKYNEKHGVVLSNTTVAKLPSVTGTVESEIPISDTETISALKNDASVYLGVDSAVLNSPTSDLDTFDATISTLAIDEATNFHNLSWQGTISQDEAVRTRYAEWLPRMYMNLADNMSAVINILWDDLDGNLLLNTYISQTFSNRNYESDHYVGPGRESTLREGDDLTFATACSEYVFGGEAEEIKNQQEAYDYIMAVRLMCNLYAVLSQAEDLDITSAYSVAAYMAWAYYETCADMQLITQHNAPVPLEKDKLILPLDAADSVASAFAGGNMNNALRALGYYNEDTKTFVITGIDCLNYTDSLSLALWFVGNSDKLLRVADLMQLEMRYQQRYVDNIPATFLMSQQNTYCRVECSAKMNSILPILSIGGTEHRLQELPLSTLRYVGY